MNTISAPSTRTKNKGHSSQSSGLLPSKLENLTPLLVCPECQGPLERSEQAFQCIPCHHHYPIKEGRIYFANPQERQEGKPKDLLFRIKCFLKKYPLLFKLSYMLQPAFAVGKGPEVIAQENAVNPVYLNLGSGTPLYWKAGNFPLTQVDLHPYPGVDLVCDASRLPFRDNTIDGVYNESLLEHTLDPQAIIAEVERVLKPGGKANFIMPLVAPYHATPNDYCRWTIPGGQQLLKRFVQLESGVRQGPVSAWLWQTQELIATTLSFGVPLLYASWLMALMIVTFPIKYLDFVVGRLPNMDRAAMTLYFVVQKGPVRGFKLETT